MSPDRRLRVRAALLPAIALLIMVIGAALRVARLRSAAELTWNAGLLITGLPIVWTTLRNIGKGRLATDIVATLAIVGAVILHQPLAGLVIVLMQSGGEALERMAEGRASAAVRALEEAAPRVAHRIVADIVGERVEEVAASEVNVGDLLLIRPGDLLPCDGVVTEGQSDLDASRLTGEPLPIEAVPGISVMSGTLNGTGAMRMRATARAAESQYARIVDLVRSAQSTKAPLQRLADRYAVWFTPVTLLVCTAVYLVEHDWTRVLAVLVVATPCPLILATPIAIVGGINRGARRHVIIRTGAALERLASATVAIFDKTGTITVGQPRVHDVRVMDAHSAEEVLRYAAAVEQGSSHRLARVIVEAAEQIEGRIPPATEHLETPGQGVVGTVNGHEVHVGSRAFVLAHCRVDVDRLARLEGATVALRAYVGVDDRLVGLIEYADEVRPEIPDVLRELRENGIDRVILLSGDHAPNARAVADRVGIREVLGDLLPSDKAAVVRKLAASGEVVMMVGDGINDAPALSTADVGIALAGHGGGITAEAADVIVLVDAADRVVDALRIGRQTIRIAKQSIWVGLGLSGAAMVAAAVGEIPPTLGALLQEGIDVAVILNALRTARS